MGILKSLYKDIKDRYFYNKYTKKLGIPYKDFYSFVNHVGRSDCETQTSFMGKTIYRNDTVSYVGCLFPIFFDRIYDFHSNSKSPTIIDCGANIGISILYFKDMYPEAKITAFEPDHDLFEICKKNMESFGFLDVNLIDAAVWNSDGILQFAVDDNKLRGRIADSEMNATTKVKSVRLKSYLENSDTIDFLKIDIEGAEYEVIKDCKDSLSNVNNLFLEYHSNPGKEQYLGEILTILKNAGFRYYIKEDVDIMARPFVQYQKAKERVFDLQLEIFAFRV